MFAPEGIRFVPSIEQGDTSSSGTDTEDDDADWEEYETTSSSDDIDTDESDDSPESEVEPNTERRSRKELPRRSERKSRSAKSKSKDQSEPEPKKSEPGVEAATFVVTEIIDPWGSTGAQDKPIKSGPGVEAAAHVVTQILDSLEPEKMEPDKNANLAPMESRVGTFLDKVMTRATGVAAGRAYINEDAERDLIPSYPPNLLARRIMTSPLDPLTQELPLLPAEELPGTSKKDKFAKKHFNKRGDLKVVLPKTLLDRRRQTSPIDPVPPMLPRKMPETELRKPRGNKVGPAPRSKDEDVVIDIEANQPSPIPDLKEEWIGTTYIQPKLSAAERAWTVRSNPYCQGDGNCDWCDLLNMSEEPIKGPVPSMFATAYGYGNEEDEKSLAQVGVKRKKRTKRSAQEIYEERRYGKDMKIIRAFQEVNRLHAASPGFLDMINIAEEFLCMRLCVPVLVYLWKTVFHIPALLGHLDMLWGKIAAKLLEPNHEDILEKVYVNEDELDKLPESYCVEVESDSDDGIRIETDYDADSFQAYCFKTMTPGRFKQYEEDSIAYHNGTLEVPEITDTEEEEGKSSSESDADF